MIDPTLYKARNISSAFSEFVPFACSTKKVHSFCESPSIDRIPSNVKTYTEPVCGYLVFQGNNSCNFGHIEEKSDSINDQFLPPGDPIEL